jgi:hypothetical protein
VNLVPQSGHEYAFSPYKNSHEYAGGASTESTNRVLPPVLVQLLLRLAREGALWARVGALPAVVHQMLF